MQALSRRAAIAAAASALAIVATAPSAHADSLVYVKGGNVWISHGDGSNPKQVTGAANTWSWPTEDDAGHILVAGGAESVNAGVEDTAGSQIYRLDQQGQSLSAPQLTPGSSSTGSCPTYPPQSLRVAPDGQHYAYHAFFCDHFITEIGTVGGSGFTSSEYMSDFVDPYWVSNSDFVASRGGEPLVDSDGEWWVHELGQQIDYGYNWFGDPANYASEGGWATGFDGIAVSRDGTKVATVEDDAANWLGAAHQVAVRLWSAGGAPSSANPSPATPSFECELDLGGDPSSTDWFDNAGPTFSPDGTRLAFAEPDGIHIANVSNLANCATVTAPLVIPGATQPFWSAANEAANAGYVSPGGGNTGGNGGPPAAQPKISSLGMHPKRFRVTGAHPGAMLQFKLAEAATAKIAFARASTGRKHGRRCVKATRRNRHAEKCTLMRTIGSVRTSASSGINRWKFTGRLHNRKLSPGRYLLTVSAVDAAGRRSSPKSTWFTVLGH
jgi:hypothetical protein